MTSQQTIKNAINITHDLSSIIMRNRAIVMIRMLKAKKEKENEFKKQQRRILNNKFCIGFCENPLNCSCFINNSI